MFVVGFRGLEVNDNHPIIKDIKMGNLGGVILFDYDFLTQKPVRNIGAPEQLKTLIEKLQDASPATPLFIAIDEEGGRVSRLIKKIGSSSAASAQDLGTINDLALTRKSSKTIAKTLAQYGINLNLAPVVDININPENPIIGKLKRSFSDDPKIVTEHALEFIKVHHQHGVLCTLKHFPGHGSSTGDSHRGLVDITLSWSQVELQPYTNIIETGEIDAIMTAHVFNATLDYKHPATLSKAIITNLLREKLNYHGVVISDDADGRYCQLLWL